MKRLSEQYIIDTCSKFQFDENYYADTEFISNSMLGLLKKSPKDLDMFFQKGGSLETPAMVFGRAFHKAILEPEIFSDEVVVYSGKTKRGKAWDEFSEANFDKDIITETEFDCLRKMKYALTMNKDISELLIGNEESTEQTEVPMVWEDPLSSVRCKGKVDILHHALSYDGSVIEGDVIVDIKTTQDASFEGFRKSAYKYGYNRQAAFYLDGFGATEFIFVVIEKKAPYNMGVYHCSDEFIESGREEYSRLLMDYRKYFVSDFEVEKYYEVGIL